MRKTQIALLLALLLTLSSSSTVGLAQPPVEKYYEVARFTTQKTNTWSNYGDLNKTFLIPSQGYVDISYGISGEVADRKIGHIVTRVLVDDKERKEFRGISGYTNYVHVSVFNRVFLSAGNHSIVLQYRTA